MGSRSSTSSPDEDPKDAVDEFLSAPDNVRKDEAESQKMLARKASEKAKHERLVKAKRRTQPSQEDLLADIVRVAEDEETNPQWHEFRSISRRRYELYGHWDVLHVDTLFGTFAHAKQQAGLEDKPGTRKKKLARAEQSRREHHIRYAERYIMPHVNKFPELDRELTGAKLMLSISDTHATFLDPFTWYVFLSACRDLKPDIVYMNGDILEGSEISRHPKISGWSIPLQLELDFARTMFQQIRKVVPDTTRVVWGAGNHGLDRMASYLSQVAPALAGLRGLKFDQLTDLGGLGVELAQGGTIASPEGTEDDKFGRLLYGFYRVYHGTKLGATPARNELLAAGRSGQSGHVHRACVHYGTTERDMGLSWMSTPMGCTPRAGRAYIRSLTAGWQTGFGYALLMPGERVHQFPVVTDRGIAAVDGYVYTRDPGLVEPIPSVNWLEDFVVPS